MRGVTEAVDKGQSFDQLARLMVQRRMHPDIASVARELIEGYRDLEDAPEVRHREPPTLLDALGTDAPLLTVDISKFNPWSGKMRGSSPLHFRAVAGLHLCTY
jgi:hypothetical protein